VATDPVTHDSLLVAQRDGTLIIVVAPPGIVLLTRSDHRDGAALFSRFAELQAGWHGA